MKTLCLAASLVSTLWGAQTAPPKQELNEDVLWGRLQKSVAILNSQSQTGVAVLVDQRGWFMAHGGIFPEGLVQTPGSVDGRVYTFQQLASDKETNLVLFQANNWKPGDGNPVVVSRAASQSGDRLLAVTIDGPVWAELGRKDRIGNMKPSQRYAPLNELRLESGKVRATGALAFNEKGQLVGVLGATLAPSPEAAQGAGGTSNTSIFSTQNFGPSDPTVAYAYGPKLLARVVEGFLSPDHVVKHPSIGIFFKKSPKGGALIDSVVRGGEAEKAGLQAGDVVFEADGQPVHEAVGFATILFNQSIGDDLMIKAYRGSKAMEFKVAVVAAQALTELMASSSFQRNSLLPR